MPNIVQPYYSIQYDGTNGEYIAGTWCTGIEFVSDTGTELTFNGAYSNTKVQLGQWVIVWGKTANDPWMVNPADYASRYYELPE